MKTTKIIAYTLFGLLVINVVVFGIANESSKQRLFYDARSMSKSQIALYILKDLEKYYPDIYSESYDEYELDHLIVSKVNDIVVSGASLPKFWILLYDHELIIWNIGKVLTIIVIVALLYLYRLELRNNHKEKTTRKLQI